MDLIQIPWMARENSNFISEYPKGVSMWTLATTAMDISFLRFYIIHTGWKKNILCIESQETKMQILLPCV